MKNQSLLIIVICALLIPNVAVATTQIVYGANARITQVQTNWDNEGRFAVYVEGGDAGSLCTGWVHFHPNYLPNADSKIHSFNYSAATAAMISGLRVEIFAHTSDCWTAVNIRMYAN